MIYDLLSVYLMFSTIQKFPMEHGHPSNPSDEFEVAQVILVTETREWIDLKRVVIPGEKKVFSMNTDK